MTSFFYFRRVEPKSTSVMDLVPRGSSPWLAKLNPSTKHSHSFATNLKRYYNLDSIATMPISLFHWGKGVLTDNARFSSPLYGFSRPMSDVVYVVKGKEEHWKFYVAIKLRAEQWSNDDKCFLGCNQPNWNHQTAVCRNSLFFSFKHKQASSLTQTFFWLVMQKLQIFEAINFPANQHHWDMPITDCPKELYVTAFQVLTKLTALTFYLACLSDQISFVPFEITLANREP